jgi:hypothetical protein
MRGVTQNWPFLIHAQFRPGSAAQRIRRSHRFDLVLR